MTVYIRIGSTEEPNAWARVAAGPVTIRYEPAHPDQVVEECDMVRLRLNDPTHDVSALEAVKALRTLVELHDDPSSRSMTSMEEVQAKRDAWSRARAVLGKPEPAYDIPLPPLVEEPYTIGGIPISKTKYGSQQPGITTRDQTGGLNVIGSGNNIDGRS